MNCVTQYRRVTLRGLSRKQRSESDHGHVAAAGYVVRIHCLQQGDIAVDQLGLDLNVMLINLNINEPRFAA